MNNNTSCSCVTFNNKSCIYENTCPDYGGEPSLFNRACLTLEKPKDMEIKLDKNQEE